MQKPVEQLEMSIQLHWYDPSLTSFALSVPSGQHSRIFSLSFGSNPSIFSGSGVASNSLPKWLCWRIDLSLASGTGDNSR